MFSFDSMKMQFLLIFTADELFALFVTQGLSDFATSASNGCNRLYLARRKGVSNQNLEAWVVEVNRLL